MSIPALLLDTIPFPVHALYLRWSLGYQVYARRSLQQDPAFIISFVHQVADTGLLFAVVKYGLVHMSTIYPFRHGRKQDRMDITMIMS